MSYSLFISDLHLDPARPEHLQALKTLLARHAGQADALYVLGDLFEAWVGDDDDAPFNLDAIAAFRRFGETRSALYFMHGNRDFLLGDDFARSAGGEMIPEETVVDLYGEPALLLHGDSLCLDDHEYQAVRQQVRDPAWQAGLLARSLAERRAYAAEVREKSKQRKENNPANIMDVNDNEVVRIMEHHGVRTLIHGHTHRPAVHDVSLSDGPGKRWVLGDWGDNGWQIVADSGRGLRLESFRIADLV
jgi:UDP-2,3-diacylglucosamine hydrolase